MLDADKTLNITVCRVHQHQVYKRMFQNELFSWISALSLLAENQNIINYLT